MNSPDGLIVERAEPHHVEQLRDALGSAHHDYFMARLVFQEYDLGEVLVAFDGEEAVGAVFVFWGEADEDELRRHLAKVPLLYHFEVRSDRRGEGIGSQLLRTAKERLRDRGYERVALGVDLSNEAARRLWTRSGFNSPEEPELSGLRPSSSEHPSESYDVLVADLQAPDYQP